MLEMKNQKNPRAFLKINDDGSTVVSAKIAKDILDKYKLSDSAPDENYKPDLTIEG